MSLTEYLHQQTEKVNATLSRWVPGESEPPQNIHKAMRYSLFAGGKRIRPILCLAAAETVDGQKQSVEDVACTLEMIHTYSLIHDDLPALDNDDLRRGRPTCHKVFGEALAILAGDALLTLAFQVLARVPGFELSTRALLSGELAQACGTVRGMIGGQVHDMEGEGTPPTAELLDSIHRAKTGALLRVSLRMGGICAGADSKELEALTRFGEHAGLAFQIVDDILDIEQSSEELGKTPGKDAKQGKITFPAVYGTERSRQMAEEERLQAHAALACFGPKAQNLRDLADLIVYRKT